MSLKAEITQILTTDPSILSMVPATSIMYAAGEDNYPRSVDYIVFDARVAGVTNVYDTKELIDEYSVTVQVVSLDAVRADNISQAVRDALLEFRSSNILNIYFERSNEVWNPDDKAITLSNDFTAVYCKN